MRKKFNNNFDRDFVFYENKTICYINIDNNEIPVTLNREDHIIKLSFNYKFKYFETENIIITNSSELIFYNLDRIIFKDIQISNIDKKNLALCIDKMFDYLFN